MGIKRKKIVSFVVIVIMFIQLLIPQTVLGAVSAEIGRQKRDVSGITYYVDSQSGDDQAAGTSEAAPWKSLEKINSTTFQPGDQILLKSGCAWYGELYPKGSGTEGNPIIIDMYGGEEKPLIDGEGKVKSAVKLRNQEYWEIYNLEVTNWSEEIGYFAGIRITAYEESRAYRHIVIKDCYIHDVHGVREFGPTDTTGISTPRKKWYEDGYSSDWFKGTGGIAIVTEDQRGTHKTSHTHAGKSYEVLHETEFEGYEGKTWFDDIVIENNIIERVSETGIRIAQSAYLPSYSAATANCIPFTNVVIRGNVINGGLEWSDFGTLITPMKDPLVEYNIAYDWRTSGLECTNTTNGIFQYNEVYNINHWDTTRTADDCAFDADLNSSNVIFQYNYAHDSGSAFLACSASNKAPIIYRYNIAQDITNRIMYGPAPGMFYNNTFYSPEENNNISVAAGMPIYNNIIYAKSLSGVSSNVTIDNNLYYGGCKVPSADKHGVYADPMFADPGKGETGTEPGKPRIDTLDGYQLQVTSPAIDRGRKIDNNGGRDYFGNPLYLDAPDIGAHEYSKEDKPKDKVSMIVLEKDRIHMAVGETQKINAQVYPDKVINKNLLFTSNQETVVSVNEEGILTAVSEGTAEITVTSEADSSAAATCTVIVANEGGKTRIIVSEDEFVRHGSYGNSTNNSGAVNGDLHVQTDANPGWQKEIYLKFDLSDVEIQENQNFMLKLYSPFLESNADEILTLSEASSEWSEKSITGNNKAGIIEEIGTFPVKNPTLGSNYTDGIWIEFDVTEYMKNRDNTEKMLTIVISNKSAPHSKCRIDFRSKDSAGNYPYLLITDSIATAPTGLEVVTSIGKLPELPEQVSCIGTDGEEVDLKVEWEPIDEAMVQKAGSFEVKGTLEDGGRVLILVKVHPHIQFDLNYEGGEPLEEVLGELGKPVGILPRPERVNYNFVEWNAKADGSGKSYTEKTIFESYDNVKLYAIWREQEDITSISLSSRRIYLNKGETFQLEAIVAPDTIVHKAVEYSSENQDIVRVDENGILHALEEGSTLITVTSLEDKTMWADCQVIVKANELEDCSLKSEFTAIDDAFVRNGGAANASQHVGDAQNYIWLKSSDVGYAREGYIQFDLDEAQYEQVDEAVLRMHVSAVGSKTETQTIRVYRTDPGWSESDITYNKAPTSKEMVAEFTLEDLPVTDKADEYQYSQWVEINLTAHVNSIIGDDTADHKLSFKLIHEEQEGEPEYNGMYSGNSVKIDSKHGGETSLHPQIVLRKKNYHPEDDLTIITKEGVQPELPATVLFSVTLPKEAENAEKFLQATPSDAGSWKEELTDETLSDATPSNATPADAESSKKPSNVEDFSTRNSVEIVQLEAEVEWEELDESWYAEKGSFQVLGRAEGINSIWEVVATVIVEEAEEQKPILAGIEISHLPKRLNYQKGQALDLDGLEVKAVYDDGTTKIVTEIDTEPEEGTILNNTGNQKIFVTYTEGEIKKSVDFTIVVQSREIESSSDEEESSEDFTKLMKQYEEERKLWRQDDKGWWYQNPDGTYAMNEWRKIAGIWYHFDHIGYMQTNWFRDIDNKWYYLNADGSMRTQRLLEQGIWYYFDETGALIK